MATSSHSQLPIVEPLRFHHVHGDQIELSENNTRATRDRLNNTLLFTNRPILPHEIVKFYIEELTKEYHGLIRFGLTTHNPDNFTPVTLPRLMPANDSREWLVPTLHKLPSIEKNKYIRLKYTAEGDIYIDFDQTDFIKYLTVSPITKDVWCALDLNGSVSQIRLVQTEARVLPNPVDRARERYLQYTNNCQQETSSIYYSGELLPGFLKMKNCDETCELTHNIAVRKSPTSSIIIDEDLKRCMSIVLQVLDMDHTQKSYFIIRCLIDGRSSHEHQKEIDATFDHITLGDEIGIRVQPEGLITFSCDNRNVKPLFHIDLTVNDNPQVQQTSYQLEISMTGRVTGLRLVGVYRPTDSEARTLPPAVGGGCLATVLYRVCPNGLSGLLLPCRHLCVCFECGQALLSRKQPCPNIKCRKQVNGCIKVYKD